MPTTLPASASAWALYTFRDEKRPEGRVALRSVVKALNDSVRAAAADPDLRAAIKDAKKVWRTRWSRPEFEKSPEWRAVRRAQSAARDKHIQPVLDQYADYGTMDSEPRFIAGDTLNQMVLDAVGITDEIDRRWFRFD
jgi:hypothetical protein